MRMKSEMKPFPNFNQIMFRRFLSQNRRFSSAHQGPQEFTFIEAYGRPLLSFFFYSSLTFLSLNLLQQTLLLDHLRVADTAELEALRAQVAEAQKSKSK